MNCTPRTMSNKQSLCMMCTIKMGNDLSTTFIFEIG